AQATVTKRGAAVDAAAVHVVQQDAVAAVIVEIVWVAGIIVGNAIEDCNVPVGIGLRVVVVNAIDVDAGVGIVGCPAAGDTHVAKSRLAVVFRRPTDGDPVFAETACLDVLDADVAQVLAARERIKNRHTAAAIGAAVLAFDDQIPDDDAAE